MMANLPRTGKPLKADQLRRNFAAAVAGYGKPKARRQSKNIIGQDRALKAIELSAKIPHSDFNVFILGQQGSGRHGAVKELFSNQAAEMPVPGDWIYVNNFETPHKPIAIELPAGKAPGFKRAMEELVDDLANDIPALFEADDYQNQRRSIEQDFGESHEKSFENLMESTKARNLILMRTPMGFMVAAAKDDRPMKPEEFKALPKKEQATIDQNISKAQDELEAVLKQIPKREKEHRNKIGELNLGVAKKGVDASISNVTSVYGNIKALAEYLDAVKADLIENADVFLQGGPAVQAGAFPVATTKHYKDEAFQRYAVNVIVSNPNGKKAGSPVVIENLPTLSNLVGRIEQKSEMGMLSTDFTMIKSGALHRANGGFLILDVRQVLSEPFAWDALKRCLKTKEIGIVSAMERYSFITTTTLDPDPIPLDVRVALVGDRQWYYLLAAYDPDFTDLFKIQADFNDEIAISDQSIREFVELAEAITNRQNLHELDQGGLLRLLSEATRIADDAEKLSLNIGRLSDILREADYFCGQRKGTGISADDLEKAVANAEERASRPRELTHEAINRDFVLIRTEGSVVGQINALSVHQIGDFSFGRPSRVTARTRMGKGTVVDIEREVELGGPLHSKGVLILTGYLSSHFALDVPMSLWASIVFEQSYGGVDGDSASAAELFALLSSLSDCPISQSFAVTGSVNQRGEIQAIGGVNQKIEGFFDICATRGLTGDQGVLIPVSNVKNLALRDRVIEAVKAGNFQIIPIATIDEGIGILTGLKAGVRAKDGMFHVQSVNYKVEAKLHDYAESLQKFGKTSSQGSTDGN
jgi:predicted ATP-dependent protease